MLGLTGVLRQRLEALVSDVSKWVRPVARHSLGPFLSTLRSEDVSVGEPLIPVLRVACQGSGSAGMIET